MEDGDPPQPPASPPEDPRMRRQREREPPSSRQKAGAEGGPSLPVGLPEGVWSSFPSLFLLHFLLPLPPPSGSAFSFLLLFFLTFPSSLPLFSSSSAFSLPFSSFSSSSLSFSSPFFFLLLHFLSSSSSCSFFFLLPSFLPSFSFYSSFLILFPPCHLLPLPFPSSSLSPPSSSSFSCPGPGPGPDPGDLRSWHRGLLPVWLQPHHHQRSHPAHPGLHQSDVAGADRGPSGRPWGHSGLVPGRLPLPSRGAGWSPAGRTLGPQAGQKSLLLNNAFVLLSAVMVVSSRAAKAFEMILLGRFLAGVNAGVGMSIQPMYLGESAPKDLRGSVALTSASFTALGLVAGQVVGLKEVLGAEEAWPLLLASNALPALIQLLLLPWAPESPRFLLIDRGDPDSCLAALRSLRGGGDLAAEMKELLAEGAAVQGKTPPAPWDLFCDRSIRRQLLSIVVLSSAMQLCGNDSMYSYASYIFRAAGIPEDKIQYWIIGTGTCELLTAVTCTLVIERSGRRALVVSGYSLMAVWAVIFMVALSLQDRLPWAPYLSMACIFAYILSFGIGPAGVTGIIPTEIFDQVSRPAAYVVSGSLLWTSLFLVGTAFPFIVEGLGHFCYLPFLAVCVCTALYVGLFLPETKGKTFLEISEEFRKCNFGGAEVSSEDPWKAPAEEEEEKGKRSTAL